MTPLHPEDLAELAWRDEGDDRRAEEDPNLDVVPEITDHPANGEEPF
ncbi:hypothetical protein ACFXJ8_26170 [Nonomuraea sp. NPDC059194]